MKNNKCLKHDNQSRGGFTLVELLAVIVILAIILVIAVPNITGIIEKTKTDAYESQVKMIEDAAKKYIIGISPTLVEGANEITLQTLVDEKYLDANILDPRCNCAINFVTSKVTITKAGDILTYSSTILSGGSEEPVTSGIHTDSGLAGNDPVLPIGAIPITRNADNNAWVVADITREWYSYGNSKWANMVLVKEEVRNANKYVDTDGNFRANVTVDELDVLAYYVWIPRYQYTIFNTKASPSSDIPEGGITIDFVAPNTTTRCSDSDNCIIGNKLVHPAFKFGDDELKGFWVGKFELTADEVACTDNNTCFAKIPTIKPNLPSLRNLNISQFVSKIDTFKTNAMYGIDNDINTDSHMMKNMEWGAVAYLTASRYGRGNTEVWNNSDNTYLTGRIGTSVDAADEATENTTAYDANPAASEASTTRNIYGVYDMSGGSWEYMMSVMKDDNNINPMSGYSDVYNSGYSGKVYDGTTWADFSGELFPNSKYYDLYDYGTDSMNLNRGKYGDATFETAGVNGDYAEILYASNPWIIRGGKFSDDNRAGVNSFSYNGGYAFTFFSARPVLTVSAN